MSLSSALADADIAESINTIAKFLAHEEIGNLHDANQLLADLNSRTESRELPASHAVDVVVLCGSAILHTAEVVFSALLGSTSRSHYTSDESQIRLWVYLAKSSTSLIY